MKPSYRSAAGDKAHSDGYQRSVIDQKGKKSDCELYVATGAWPAAWGEPKPIIKKKSAPVHGTPFMEVSLFSRKTSSKARPHTILSKSDFLKMFSKHVVRTDKDGKMFSPQVFNGSRSNANFVSATGINFDFDHGQPRIADFLKMFPGVLMAWHSTYSHCWKSQEGKVKNDDGTITIIPADTTYTPENPRYRFIVPLSRPVNADEHALLVAGVKSIVPPELMECLDTGCFDRSRAHYLPSCIPGHEQYAVAGHQDGDPLDVDHFISLGRELEPLAVEHPDDNPQPAPAEVEPPTTFEVTDPTTGEMVDLAVWAAQNPNFDLVAAIDPQYFRNNPNDGKQHIVCPFEDQHTDQGLDLATFAANASPPQYPSWDLHCCHAHCADRDRLEFIQAMIEKGWIPFDQIRVNAPPVVELRRPRFVSFQIQEILSAPEWSTLMADERRIALDLMMMMWAEIDGMVADNDWMLARRLGLPEKEWLSYRETLARTGWLIESDGRLMNGISKREFDHAQASYMSAVVSGAKGGRKAAENRRGNSKL